MSDTPSRRPVTPPDQGIRRRTPSAPGRPRRRAPQEDPEAPYRQSRFRNAMNDAGNKADDDDRIKRTTGELPPKSTEGPALSQESLRF